MNESFSAKEVFGLPDNMDLIDVNKLKLIRLGICEELIQKYPDNFQEMQKKDVRINRINQLILKKKNRRE